MNDLQIRQLAEKHVDWYLKALKPQLIDHMIHGYKHGFEDGVKTKDNDTNRRI